MNWMTIESAPENKPVHTKIDDGKGIRNEAVLRRRGRLWFMADNSMYVYYQPTHWRWLTEMEEYELEQQGILT